MAHSLEVLEDVHGRDVLGVPLSQNLEMITDSVAFLRNHGKRVFYDAEHFFDGYRANPEYALQTLQAAASAGASVVILCDTNGGTLPHEVSRIVSEVAAHIPGSHLGIHTHNDGALAVANALAALDAGATHVQGTINGIGEVSPSVSLSYRNK